MQARKEVVSRDLELHFLLAGSAKNGWPDEVRIGGAFLPAPRRRRKRRRKEEKEEKDEKEEKEEEEKEEEKEEKEEEEQEKEEKEEED